MMTSCDVIVMSFRETRQIDIAIEEITDRRKQQYTGLYDRYDHVMIT
jgi:hypothetical protein